MVLSRRQKHTVKSSSEIVFLLCQPWPEGQNNCRPFHYKDFVFILHPPPLHLTHRFKPLIHYLIMAFPLDASILYRPVILLFNTFGKAVALKVSHPLSGERCLNADPSSLLWTDKPGDPLRTDSASAVLPGVHTCVPETGVCEGSLILLKGTIPLFCIIPPSILEMWREAEISWLEVLLFSWSSGHPPERLFIVKHLNSAFSLEPVWERTPRLHFIKTAIQKCLKYTEEVHLHNNQPHEEYLVEVIWKLLYMSPIQKM